MTVADLVTVDRNGIFGLLGGGVASTAAGLTGKGADGSTKWNVERHVSIRSSDRENKNETK